MDKKNKSAPYNENNKVIICLIIVMALLVLNFLGVILHLHNYDDAKTKGNDKWHQVENYLVEYDDRLQKLERGDK